MNDYVDYVDLSPISNGTAQFICNVEQNIRQYPNDFMKLKVEFDGRPRPH